MVLLTWVPPRSPRWLLVEEGRGQEGEEGNLAGAGTAPLPPSPRRRTYCSATPRCRSSCWPGWSCLSSPSCSEGAMVPTSVWAPPSRSHPGVGAGVGVGVGGYSGNPAPEASRRGCWSCGPDRAAGWQGSAGAAAAVAAAAAGGGTVHVAADGETRAEGWVEVVVVVVVQVVVDPCGWGRRCRSGLEVSTCSHQGLNQGTETTKKSHLFILYQAGWTVFITMTFSVTSRSRPTKAKGCIFMYP